MAKTNQPATRRQPRSCSSPSIRKSKPLPESDLTRRPKPLPESDSSPVSELFEAKPPPLPPKQRKLASSVHSLGSQVSKSPSFSSKGSVASVQTIPLPRPAFQGFQVEWNFSWIMQLCRSKTFQAVNQRIGSLRKVKKKLLF